MVFSDNPEPSSDTDCISSQASDFERNPEEPRPAVLNNRKNYLCDLCGLDFFRKDAYDRHIYSHTGVKNYECSEDGCDKKYSNQSHLKRHVKTAHKHKSPDISSSCAEYIKCDYKTCSKLFKTKAGMESHFSKNHVQERFFTCTECSEKFKRKMLLKRHLYKHTEEYPHKCNVCAKGFADLKSYQRHKVTHNSRQSKTCDVCMKDFSKWTDLVAHKKVEHVIHHKCEQCNQLFYSKTNLKQHQKIHYPKLERTVYECPHEKCPKFYFDNKNLRFHIRSKHEGKKFICSHQDCKRELSTKQKLEQHLRMHVSANRNMSPVSFSSTGSTRKQRKDAGTIKVPAACILTNVIVEDPEVKKLIIEGRGNEIIVESALFENPPELTDDSDINTTSK